MPSLRREYAVASVLLVNTFSWLFIAQGIVNRFANSFSEGFLLRLAFPSSIILAMFIGATFLSSVRRDMLFHLWLLFGVVTALLLGLPMVSMFAALITVVLVGVSVGLGVPSALAYFAECIPIEKRGKVSGICLLATTLVIPIIALVMSNLDFMTRVILLSAWRGWSIPILLHARNLTHKSYHKIEERKPVSLVTVFKDRTFVLYFVAWLMFCLVDGIGTRTVLHSYLGEFRFLMTPIESIFASVSAVIAGLFSDWVGRKRVLVFGFILLGIAYAVVSLASQLWVAWVFYFIIDGVAIGILWVLFVMVIWGDLTMNQRQKYYALGETPFFLNMIAPLLFEQYAGSIPIVSTFSLAAFFLFVAVIPLLYAKETMPKTKIDDRKLKVYTEEAIKLKQKVVQK